MAAVAATAATAAVAATAATAAVAAAHSDDGAVFAIESRYARVQSFILRSCYPSNLAGWQGSFTEVCKRDFYHDVLAKLSEVWRKDS